MDPLCLPMDLEEDIQEHHLVRVVNASVHRLDDAIFDDRGFWRFLLRGIKKVTLEVDLLSAFEDRGLSPLVWDSPLMNLLCC